MTIDTSKPIEPVGPDHEVMYGSPSPDGTQHMLWLRFDRKGKWISLTLPTESFEQCYRNVPPPKPKPYVGWANIYPSGRVYCYETKNIADTWAETDRIACVQVREVTPGPTREQVVETLRSSWANSPHSNIHEAWGDTADAILKLFNGGGDE